VSFEKLYFKNVINFRLLTSRRTPFWRSLDKTSRTYTTLWSGHLP